MAELTIELVPSTAWFSNLRSEVRARDWNTCKAYVRERSGSRCEVCGGVGRRHPVDCHEIWHYDDERKIQRLDGLIALCPACHEVKHIGLAGVRGRGPDALMHLARVNDWTPQQAGLYVHEAMATWQERSRFEWELDISWLERELGIKAKKPEGK